MFRHVEMVVVPGPELVFRFAEPLSIEVLAVSNRSDEVLWEIIAEEFVPTPVSGGSFQAWPIDKAPPGLLAMLSEVEGRLARDLEERGPRKPPLSEVTFGKLPEGYREKMAGTSLEPGEYGVIVFAEQGQANARFTIAA